MMENTFRNFNSTLIEGNLGEFIIKSYLESCGYLVLDKSDDVEYQKKDIDFEYSKDKINFYSLEVKSDNRMSETGNLAIEMAMYRYNGRKQGWFHYCEADVLCFYDTIQCIAYFLDWKKLKKLILSNIWSFKMFDNKIDNCKGSLCLVPINDLDKYNLLLCKVKI